MCTTIHGTWTSRLGEKIDAVRWATQTDCGERKDRRIIYSYNMATAIDDRQELLEQFQAVSPFVVMSLL